MLVSLCSIGHTVLSILSTNSKVRTILYSIVNTVPQACRCAHLSSERSDFGIQFFPQTQKFGTTLYRKSSIPQESTDQKLSSEWSRFRTSSTNLKNLVENNEEHHGRKYISVAFIKWSHVRTSLTDSIASAILYGNVIKITTGKYCSVRIRVNS